MDRALMQYIRQRGGDLYCDPHGRLSLLFLGTPLSGEDELAVARLLRSLPELEVLILAKTGIVGAALEGLRSTPLLKYLNLSGTAITDESLSHLRYVPELEQLTLDGTRVTTEGCDSLMLVPKLQMLSLNETAVDGTILQKLCSFKHLNDIRLDHTNITNDQLLPADLSPQLKSLYLGYTTVGDSGLKHALEQVSLELLGIHHTQITNSIIDTVGAQRELRLLDLLENTISDVNPRSRLQKLRYLSLHKTRINDAGMAGLTHLTALQYLDLHTEVSSGGIEHIKDLPRLRHLDVGMSQVCDRAVEYISHLYTLEELGFAMCFNVTGRGVEKLKHLTQLRFLDLRGPKISQGDLGSLRQALPHTHIAVGGEVVGPQLANRVRQSVLLELMSRLEKRESL